VNRKRVDITEKQAEVFTYILEFVENNGYQPSVKEMAEAFGISRKALRDRLMQLAMKGYVEMPIKHSERAIRLLHVKFVRKFAE